MIIPSRKYNPDLFELERIKFRKLVNDLAIRLSLYTIKRRTHVVQPKKQKAKKS